MRKILFCLSLFCLMVISLTGVYSQPSYPPQDLLDEALRSSSYEGTVEEVKFLLNLGADRHAKNRTGYDAFDLAVTNSNYPVVEFYLKEGQNPNVVSGGVTPLRSAAATRDMKLLMLLLRYKADPNYPGDGEGNALMSATGDTQIFMTLVAHKANIHARDNYGRTVLMWAALHGTEEVVSFLCRMGVDPEAKDKGGNTALSEARSKGRENVVKLLENCRKN
ncbi:MAG: hypothetical protein A2W09_05665 [Deltaproteobacteria bacterium RBG_16_50_11]|nr:MAG: hypothetical protein A2W09_05665 [Deltaproteobacteria bacterium RBG_16_50_11]